MPAIVQRCGRVRQCWRHVDNPGGAGHDSGAAARLRSRHAPTAALAPVAADRAVEGDAGELRERLVVAPLWPLPRFVAGADAAFSADKKSIYAVALVYDRETQRVVEVAHAVQDVAAPYIPGFLSFREGPAVGAAIKSLTHPFGVVCFDGQGYAHPRRCGLGVARRDHARTSPASASPRAGSSARSTSPPTPAGSSVAADGRRRADRLGPPHPGRHPAAVRQRRPPRRPAARPRRSSWRAARATACPNRPARRISKWRS